MNVEVDPNPENNNFRRSLQLSILFGMAIFASMLVWSQLVPLGAGPDEPSNFVKSAALIRGESTGQSVDKWVLSIDGWAYDSNSGIRRVIVTADGLVVGEGVPSMAREDVADFLSIDAESLVGFSIKSKLPNNAPRSYAVYAELNDGTLVILNAAKAENIVTSPSFTKSVDGKLPSESASTDGSVDLSSIAANLDLSYWSTRVDIDPQFGVALQIPWCFATHADKPGCNSPIEKQAIVDDPPWTGMGRYPPGGFAVAGIGTLAGPNDFAFRLSRAVNASACALLLALAFACLRRRSLSVVPLLIALTPGVIFISSVISPSGLEICAAVVLWAVLPSFFTATNVHRTEAVSVALAGLFLITARPLGALLYGTVVVTAVVASGSMKNLWAHMRRHKFVYGLHSIAVLFAAWWYVFIFNAAVDPEVTASMPKISFGAQLLHAIGDIPRVIDESIGNYGWLDTPTPRPIALAIFIVTVSLVVVGWRSLTQSARRAVGLLGLACAVLVIAEDFQYYNILRNFGAQGRHITPLLAGIPILGARYLRISDRSKWVVVGIWCGTVVGSGMAALRRYSVGVAGDNALDMFIHPVWSPPVGIAWSIVLLTASICGVGIVVMSSELKKKNDLTDL